MVNSNPSSQSLKQRLAGRVAIDHITYENLHKGLQSGSVVEPEGEFALIEIGESGVQEGARRYKWIDAQKSTTTLPQSPLIANSTPLG